MDLELILNILCGAIPLLYLIVYVAKQNKKKKNRNYLYGFIVAVVMALILIVIRLLVLTVLPINIEAVNNTNTTTKTTEVTTESTTTTTKAVDPDFQRVEVPTGGEVLGKTSKGYEVKKVDGIYYVDGYLIANKTYTLPQTYNPGGITSQATKAYKRMFADAKAEKGFNLTIASGFRSYDDQNRIYNNYVNRDGKAEADTYSARPGHSEHQTGLAFDVCDSSLTGCITNKFDNTKQAEWLNENAYKYGFILRYVKDKTNETGYIFESWHFRYVGAELAEKLYNNGNWITMEDYFGLTSSYDIKPIGE